MDFYRDGEAGAWIAASASAVEEVLQNDALHVCAPAHAGSIFDRFMRMREGVYHEELKRAALSAFDTFAGRVDLRTWCGERADEFPERTQEGWTFRFAPFAVACALGFAGERALAAAYTTSRFARTYADEAADELLRDVRALIESGKPGVLLEPFLRACDAARVERDAVEANAVGFLFQSYDATAALVQDRVVEQTRRLAARDTIVCGHLVAAGDEVRVLLGEAGRDPRSQRSFAFGYGRHACPGEGLARAIAATAVYRMSITS
jgi:cytochrome P450